ncbi:hypothetical protein Lal_00045672 [Lupinus albus]|uniref:Putative tetratricopeptide-like helical domain, pentacotripeptide-repeat region of PRORP n=1 Tax=Lupinus albus TaxID=3870 RepID=A0A6A4P4U1_LUPAL|nr:putative tetratricopeptide-like helical domain, pentacotripeptide-repeat region of PRORP [Lupinus albus]KAF1886440.1 hypothetical protein Lal_00045672 [Lupinus albus]
MRYSYCSYFLRRRNLSTRSRSSSSPNNNSNTDSSSFISGFDANSTLSSLKIKQPSLSDDSSNLVFKQISSIFYGGELVKRPGSEKIDGEKEFERTPKISWLSNISQSNIFLRRKEPSREKKQKCMFELSQRSRFERLIEICAKVLGTGATIELFGKVGREPGLKGYTTLIEMCIERARGTGDDDIAIEEMGKVFHLFKSMREQGLDLAEQAYRPLLLYIIEMCLVEEFHFFCNVIKDENPSSLARLGYYEMMLWLRVNNEEKIQGLCDYILENDDEDASNLRESYLLALCESEQKKQILDLLEIVDIKKLSSTESVSKIFQALGRLLLEHVAEKFLLDFKTCDHEADNITNFIASYTINIPNVSVEDLFTIFKDLHQRLDVSPSSSSYEKLILRSCALLKVPTALGIVDEMCEAGLIVSTEVLHSILQTCEETCQYNLVHRVLSTIRRFKLETNDEMFRCMIDLFLKMKDHQGAYKMLDDLEEINLKPTASMYNVIMAECFSEKNIRDGVRVLEHMQNADVKADSQTFSYLISNSETEEDIVKYYEELKQSGVEATKQIFIALINAYAACGQLEKAKQVVLDPLIPVKSLNQIKSVLVSVLASHGQLSEALLIYEEIKQAGHILEPKDIMNIIERTHSDGELDRLLLLLEELNDTDYWNGACCRIILYCILNKHLSSAVDLCKLLKDKFQNDELVMDVLFDKVFSPIELFESESRHLHTSLELLSEMKDKHGLLFTQECYDLLSARANTTDLHNAD